MLSFIVPVYNEEENISRLSTEFHRLRQQGHEVIVIDGGSTDKTVECLENAGIKICLSGKGRATQMNKGARMASGEALVFLHADTVLPQQAEETIINALQTRPWGRFNVCFTSKDYIFKVVASLMNIRSCITGIATGDQCIFVKKDLFENIGGYQDIPLMEDVALSASLKKHSRPYCLTATATTSSRRWEEKGTLKTIVLMWYLRLAFYVGVPAEKLHKRYYD